uniref:Uncharacterized protein n=1 Tax=Romanomermis culicivorax TaxID=13658 RepID=A0A915I990_ROMCU
MILEEFRIKILKKPRILISKEFFQHPRGVWAEIGIERSAENKEYVLQSGPKNEKKTLPANFFLTFNKPIVLSIDMITKLTELSGFEPTKTHPECKNALESFGTEVFVSLKDQNHKYNFEYSKSNPSLQSFACSTLKFTNALNLAPILKILRSSLNYFGALRSLEDHSKMEVENFERDQFFPLLISSSNFGKLEVLFQNPAFGKKNFVGVKFTFRSLMCETEVDFRTVGEPKITPLSEIARKNIRQFLCLCLTMRAVVKRVIGAENTDKCFGDALTPTSKKRKFVDVDKTLALK